MSGLSHPILAAGRAAQLRRPGDGWGGRWVAAWLFAMAILVLAMVVVGGATRLTGSGLSITQWKPVSGVLPPMNAEGWASAFQLYRATPQYHLVNRGMSLEAFQVIYWWEWSHRLLGRLIGMVFALPIVVLAVTGRLRGWLLGRCALLLGLGALQGLVGWWMVKSGLEDRISVAPERLAAHLGLALILYGTLLWTALDVWNGPAVRRRGDGWTLAGGLMMIGVYLQCLLGALVAGAQGGLVDKDWPFMGGRLIPAGYGQGSLWTTLARSPTAIQFHHRLGAYALAALALTLAARAVRSTRIPSSLRPLAVAVGTLTLVQAALGVTMLILGVPLWLAIFHQATACLLLAVAVVLTWRSLRS